MNKSRFWPYTSTPRGFNFMKISDNLKKIEFKVLNPNPKEEKKIRTDSNNNIV